MTVETWKQFSGQKITVFVVGKSMREPDSDDSKWEIIGVFDEIKDARQACHGHPQYFIGPIEANTALPDETMDWPGAFYPGSDGDPQVDA